MTGNDKPGNALADKWREKFEHNRKETDLPLTRLEVRADMKSCGEEELSDVIDRETLERQKVKAIESEPPSKANLYVIGLTIVKKFPPMGAVIVAVVLGLAGIAAYVALNLKK